MDQNIGQITDWLMGQVDSAVIIRKEEQGDTDQIAMKVQKVSYHSGHPDRDDYIEEDRLVLLGEGSIATEGEGGSARLPRDSYEIPLGPSLHWHMGEDSLQVSTERANYTITRQPSS